MERALDQADVAPADICYINAHATSTPMGQQVVHTTECIICGQIIVLAGWAKLYALMHTVLLLAGDDIEQQAIADIFAPDASCSAAPVLVSSTKGATGAEAPSPLSIG